jgi:hypothetical protein
MAIYSNLDYGTSKIKDLVYVKTNINGYFFDAFLQINHVSKLNITTFPVQTGANISDHAFLEPKELTLDIGMTDVATSLVADQFVGSWSRSVKAYQILRDLQLQRIPMQVLTRLGIYQNMLIESLSVPDSNETLYGLKCTVTMKEVIVATTRTVKVSSRPHVTDSTNRGNAEPADAKESILYGQFGSLIPSASGKGN